MSARELTVFAYSLVTDGRTDTELHELEDWLTTDPGVRAEKEKARRLAAIARMGGGIVAPTVEEVTDDDHR